MLALILLPGRGGRPSAARRPGLRRAQRAALTEYRKFTRARTPRTPLPVSSLGLDSRVSGDALHPVAPIAGAMFGRCWLMLQDGPTGRHQAASVRDVSARRGAAELSAVGLVRPLAPSPAIGARLDGRCWPPWPSTRWRSAARCSPSSTWPDLGPNLRLGRVLVGLAATVRSWVRGWACSGMRGRSHAGFPG